jgi:hypothetical protein
LLHVRNETYSVQPFCVWLFISAPTASVAYSLYEFGRCSWETHQFMFIRKVIQKVNLCCPLSCPCQVLGEWKKSGGLGAVPYAYNPSYLGGGRWRIVQRYPVQRVSKTPFQLISQVSS